MPGSPPLPVRTGIGIVITQAMSPVLPRRQNCVCQPLTAVATDQNDPHAKGAPATRVPIVVELNHGETWPVIGAIKQGPQPPQRPRQLTRQLVQGEPVLLGQGERF